MLTIEMLPAAHGDALVVQYGDSPDRLHRILVDGGPWTTYDALRSRILRLGKAQRRFELLVITHVDTDHIDGVIRLLQDARLGVEFDHVWFNGYEHIQRARATLGGVQGEFLEALLRRDGLRWNDQFERGRISVETVGGQPSITLRGGLKITILSPDDQRLADLEKKWTKVVKQAGFTPGDSESALKQLKERAEYGPPKGVLGEGPDTSEANGSSIAMLVQYGDKKAVLAGDAFADVLEASIRRLAPAGKPLEVNAFKLPHHGSFGNITPSLLRVLKTGKYLFSTNGARYKHPDADTIELILEAEHESPPELIFNYRSDFTKKWLKKSEQEKRNYTAVLAGGVEIAL
jgi:beta-lactamase superfamily II metal-dependent hydrolase